MQGLGNDFVVIAGPAEPTAQEIAAWCDRRRGVGADGVLEVTPMDETTVRMRYWNADGGAAEMCGNGLRCVARYARYRGWVETDSFVVDTAVGPRPVRLNPDGSVRVLLGTAATTGDVSIDSIVVHTVDMGNPHAIQWVKALEEAPVHDVGPVVETAPVFPAGTNAEFAQLSGPNEIDLRIWERGVGETLACGTGAAATAFLAHEQGLVGSEVVVNLPGGPLKVAIEEHQVWIEGPAEVVFSGVL